jgi:hypothetical protein
MNKLTLVWNRPRSSVWEVEWIEYLFRNIPHDTVENNEAHDLFWDNCVVIDTVRWAPYHNDYINTLLQKGYKFGIVDLSDELLEGSPSYDVALFVLRQLYKPDMPEHVVHIPCGYNKGFVSDKNPPAVERSRPWAFICNRWDDRRAVMRDAMSQVAGGFFYSGVENNGVIMTPAEMGDIYRDSVFIPCPHGWFVIDTLRVTEALEAGCIPIVDADNYWENLYGEVPPFLQITDWTTAADVVKMLQNDPEALEQLRLDCYNWWCRIKDETTECVEDLVKQMMLLKNNT